MAAGADAEGNRAASKAKAAGRHVRGRGSGNGADGRRRKRRRGRPQEELLLTATRGSSRSPGLLWEGEPCPEHRPEDDMVQQINEERRAEEGNGIFELGRL